MSFFKSKQAVVINHNKATDEIDVSQPIESIGKANQASAGVISVQGGIVLDKETNDHGGNETVYVAPSGQPGIWHVQQHIVVPESEI